MSVSKRENEYLTSSPLVCSENGFSLVEVIVAGALMIILCVGILPVFSYVANVNRGNNIRAQALSALQQEIEFYRSVKFIPGLRTAADLPSHRHPHFYGEGGMTWTRPQVTSASGMVFDITVTVTNLSYAPGLAPSEEACTFKEIRIHAVPAVRQNGWLSDANLKTDITMQRVRAN